MIQAAFNSFERFLVIDQLSQHAGQVF